MVLNFAPQSKPRYERGSAHFTFTGSGTWSASKTHSCEICGRRDRCHGTAEGAVFCKDTHWDVSGWRYTYDDSNGFGILWPEDGTAHRTAHSEIVHAPPAARREPEPEEHWHWPSLLRKLLAHPCRDAKVKELAGKLVPACWVDRYLEALIRLRCCWLPREAWVGNIMHCCTDEHSKSWSGCWAFPQHDGKDDLHGFGTRYEGGFKASIPGTNNIGLYLDATGRWLTRARELGFVLLAEGPTSTASLLAMDLPAVGRPNNRCGAEAMADLLRDLDPGIRIIVLADYDPRPDKYDPSKTLFPGRDGGKAFAKELSELLGRDVELAFCPWYEKDARDWLNKKEFDDQAGERFFNSLVLLPSDRQQQALAAPSPSSAPVPADGCDGACAEDGLAPDVQVASRDHVHAEYSNLHRGNEYRQYVCRCRREGRDPTPYLRWLCARRIADLRSDREMRPCPPDRCRIFKLSNKETHQPFLQWVRCEEWSCPGCGPYLRRREELSAEFHWSQVEKLYYGSCPVEKWGVIRGRLARYRKKNKDSAGVKYLRCQCNGMYHFWLNVKIKDTEKTSLEEALELLHKLLNDWTGSFRPVTTSHGWSLVPPEEAGSGQNRFHGEAPPDVMEHIDEICKKHNCTPIEGDAPRHPRCPKRLYLNFNGTTTSDRTEKLFDDPWMDKTTYCGPVNAVRYDPSRDWKDDEPLPP